MYRLTMSGAKRPSLSWTKSLSPRKLVRNGTLLSSKEILLANQLNQDRQRWKLIPRRNRKWPRHNDIILAILFAIFDTETSIWNQFAEIFDFLDFAFSVKLKLDVKNSYNISKNSRQILSRSGGSQTVGCILDDKVFARSFSLMSDHFKQPLTDPFEIFLRIKSCREDEQNPEFLIIARAEALMTGWTVKEALSRTLIYLRAGADVVIIRSKIDSDIADFVEALTDKLPILIIPTNYFVSSTNWTEQLGISVSVWREELYAKLIDSSYTKQ